MSQQAGIYKVVLYEDKNLTYLYYDSDTIVNLSTDGDTFEFTNCLTPQIDITPIKNNNNELAFNYGARLIFEDFDDNTLDDLQSVYESLYGWKLLVYFYDGTIKFLDEVLKVKDTSFNINESMTLNCELLSAQPSKTRFVEYDPDISMSEYKADTTLITADDTTITADYY